MKNILLLLLLPFFAIAQKQIGSDINGKLNDELGKCLAFSADGNFIAVSLSGDDKKVRVYKNVSNEWIQIGNDIINGDIIESRGENPRSISLSADGSIVALAGNMVSHDGTSFFKLKIYRNIENSWKQIGEDIKKYEQRSGIKAYSISLSADGNVVALGAPEVDVNKRNNAGSVSVFKNIDNKWKQLGNDIIESNIKFKYFGNSISLSSDGSIIAIGLSSFNSLDCYGRVKVLKNIDDKWTQIGNDIKGLEKGCTLATNISLSSDGNTIAVTSYKNFNFDETITETNCFNSVKIFKNVLNNWNQIGNDINARSIDDNLYNAVSLSGDGNILAISYPPSTLKGSKGLGFARIYKNISSSWVQIGKDIKGDKDQYSFEAGFANSITLSSDGRKVAIGHPSKRLENNISRGGQVRVYDLSNIK